MIHISGKYLWTHRINHSTLRQLYTSEAMMY